MKKRAELTELLVLEPPNLAIKYGKLRSFQCVTSKHDWIEHCQRDR